MKIIFLDIDGVLNWIGTKDRVYGFVGLDPERIARLNQITDAHPDAKIVVSSTWRRSPMPGYYKDFEGLKVLLAQRGVKAEIIGPTPVHFSRSLRGAEIKEWINANSPSNGDIRFVVLDDDTSGMQPLDEEDFDLRPFHVVSHWDGDPNVHGEEGGLLDLHVKMAIDVLNGDTTCLKCRRAIANVPETNFCKDCTK